MSALPDMEARRVALSAIDRSLLVEAGAGSGKTSLMAGRVAVLFAHGVAPKHVAAITFTEFAASELRQRIERFTSELSGGSVPRDLRLAFPDGLTEAARRNVAAACAALDELTCTTIHGFAQGLIKPYPAEAGIDPGAEIVDPAEADLAFQERLQTWLKQQLGGDTDGGIVAELVIADEKNGLKLLSEIADFLKRNREARPHAAAWSHEAVARFAEAARQFERELGGIDYAEAKTAEACQAFLTLIEIVGGPALLNGTPSNRALVAALNCPRHQACFTQARSRRQLQGSGAWQNAAAAGGWSKAEGKAAFERMKGRYDSCHDALDALLGAIAGEVLARVSDEMRGLLDEWRAYKRAAALLDFDDLLYTARDLLAGHEEVRRALANRYRYVLVDEFQDTDPLQTEILWRLCGEATGADDTAPLARMLRPGALFLVGDPKQAIYYFRGADVNAYVDARTAIGAANRLSVTANFRSVAPILDFVNRRFAGVLSAPGQPGFSALSPMHAAVRVPCVAALAVAGGVDGEKAKAAVLRDAEAECIAELCRRLVGQQMVRDTDTGAARPCRYGDIALLAPVGTDLWRFEEALEQRGIPVSTQAGKGFFRRQEIQDLIALTRALADGRDTLALGALLRGPLVGLTEAELLDIADALPADPERPGRLAHLSLQTDPDHIGHAGARTVIEALQSLRGRARGTTPYALLSDAAAMLHVRAQVRQRFRGGAERAIANIDLYLELARAYDVRGLRAFARDMRANWEEAMRQVEGRPDAERDAVSLITFHAAKGLEWPIVVPINAMGEPKSETGTLHDRRAKVFSVRVLGAPPAGYADLYDRCEQERRREYARMWYVAATRARDLLVLPRHTAALGDKCWAKVVDLGLAELEQLAQAADAGQAEDSGPPVENGQTREIFAAQAAGIAARRRTLTWQRPSRDEAEHAAPESVPVTDSPERTEIATAIPVAAVAGGSRRGVLLHKLMEEVLTGELGEDAAAVAARAAELLAQLGIQPATDPAQGLAPAELAATVARTLSIPEIAALRPHLVPELPVLGHAVLDGAEVLVSGVADAVAPDGEGGIAVVVDWKSDVTPAPDTLAAYRGQIEAYRRHVGARRALIVLMTPGTVIEVA